MDDLRVERVLRCVECVPPGRAAPYSMIGRITGESARAVGRVMSLYGSNVAWWRVTNVAGALPPQLLARAGAHWDAEALPHTAAGADLARCLADEDELRARWAARVRGLAEGECAGDSAPGAAAGTSGVPVD
ncbi:cysteine methyltransferase [Brevibacterium sp. 5221]|uniref:Cysteine methyltransferase n=1 Tax=Brevibacterium rongguiense TaxID=2695267 RepID=A0A6N9HAG5_9MICO|nr:MGMT family protein [Brevibacterium rongguiense]MYM20786.1 cysteine methyltransferase [Brevibacterium rongguiense]